MGEISCVLSCVFLHLGSYIMHLGITHMERSKELTQLGIITIGVSIVTEMVAAIVYEIMSCILASTDSLEISNWGSIGIGYLVGKICSSDKPYCTVTTCACGLYWNSMLCERLAGRTGILLKENGQLNCKAVLFC